MTDKPKVYFCPTAGEVERYPGGGFDICCDRPEMHRLVRWADLFGIDPDYTKDAAEEPKYTESELRVLTEAALRLGRKEALDEAAAKADWLAEGVANPEKPYNEAFIHACGVVARHIRDLASQAAPAASEPRTDPGMDSDLPPEPQAVTGGSNG